MTVDGERVSSTRVRDLLTVNRTQGGRGSYWATPTAIRGRVVYGRQLGRQIGAPTANILLPHMPALKGVYVVSATLEDGRVLDGVANIGLRPTVDGKQPSLEVHLFDFAGTLYGQHLEVVFRHGLRDEEKFGSVNELKDQIARDFEHARAWIAENGSVKSPD